VRLVDNWQTVALKAWSMRWMYAATALGGVEVVLPLFEDSLVKSIGRGVFAALSVLALLLGIVSRVIQQKEISGADK
jgi:TRAP-type C4-dicarboxylate transport system permease small subunit